MKQKILSAVLVAGLVAVTAPAQAQSVSAIDGTTSSVTSVSTYAVQGNDMGGMKISATLLGGSAFSSIWGSLGGSLWGADIYDGSTHIAKVTMGATTDTYSGSWTVYLYQSTKLTNLTFEGGQSFGSVLFDRTNGGAQGTAGSNLGRDFDLSGSGWTGVTAQYSNAVGLGAAPLVRDIYSKVSVNFGSACYDPPGGGSTCYTDAPNSSYASQFSFQMDADKGVFATSTVPEPSTYALMIAGLAALGMASRRRRNNA